MLLYCPYKMGQSTPARESLFFFEVTFAQYGLIWSFSCEKFKRPIKPSASETYAKRISTNRRHHLASQNVFILFHVTVNEKNKEVNISHFATVLIKARWLCREVGGEGPWGGRLWAGFLFFKTHLPSIPGEWSLPRPSLPCKGKEERHLFSVKHFFSREKRVQ